jgi:hypothetical protein
MAGEGLGAVYDTYDLSILVYNGEVIDPEGYKPAGAGMPLSWQ